MAVSLVIALVCASRRIHVPGALNISQSFNSSGRFPINLCRSQFDFMLSLQNNFRAEVEIECKASTITGLKFASNVSASLRNVYFVSVSSLERIISLLCS